MGSSSGGRSFRTTSTKARATFGALFPGIGTEPWPVQEAAIACVDRDARPQLVIIEAPMGEGKSEAAMYLTDAWNAQDGTRGTYFALPTMATSNQMFGRVREFLRQRYPEDFVNLQLRHGHASLSSEFDRIRQHGRSLPEPSYSADVHDGRLIVADWFSPAKRGLLAPFGVGTIDQLLMAVLRVKHGAVRLFGMAAKPMIMDEIHAYDTYTSTLIERSLTWLAALGAPVVILSATLPARRRAALVAAYREGMGVGEPAPLPASPYPRLTIVGESGDVEVVPVQAAQRSARTIALLRHERDDLQGLVDRLDSLLREGGCAAVICNTVGRAQEVYQLLRAAFPGLASDGEPLVDLLHARYTVRDRQHRELRSLARFGREGREVVFPDGITRPVDRPERVHRR